MQHYTDLHQITTSYSHVYLSPHLDDAVLSCGGAIAAQSALGNRVLVVHSVLRCQVLSSLGHWPRFMAIGTWANEDAVTVRLREDLLAMELIGADCLWAGLLNSIYRLPFAYDTRERLFGTPQPTDPLYQFATPADP